jgi:DNA-directed RNA polymerase sigma subunit (sigma70/sigma32)
MDLVETLNRIVLATRKRLLETGEGPTPEALAEELAIPVEEVRRALDLALRPVILDDQ